MIGLLVKIGRFNAVVGITAVAALASLAVTMTATTLLNLQGLVLTLGSAGARLYTPGDEPLQVAPGEIAELVDTVGAGDAFASVIILGLLRGWPPRLTLERAQQFASKIVGQRGATTTERSFYQPFIDNWQLNSE